MLATSSTNSQKSARPYWLVACVFLAIAGALGIAGNDQYQTIFFALSRGLTTTLWVTVAAFTLATLLGLFVALARLSPRTWVSQTAIFYIEIVRGVPVLVLLFYIAFVGGPQIIALLNWICSPLIERGVMDAFLVRDFSMAWRAVLALMISYSAFIAEIFRAGIQSVDRGQVEAAQSLGLSRWQTFRLVVFPQALRTILPPLGNEFVAMIKDSALVSALGVQDVTQMGKLYSASTFLFFETYTLVAYIYLMLTISLSLAVRGLEIRLGRGVVR